MLDLKIEKFLFKLYRLFTNRNLLKKYRSHTQFFVDPELHDTYDMTMNTYTYIEYEYQKEYVRIKNKVFYLNLKNLNNSYIICTNWRTTILRKSVFQYLCSHTIHVCTFLLQQFNI